MQNRRGRKVNTRRGRRAWFVIYYYKQQTMVTQTYYCLTTFSVVVIMLFQVGASTGAHGQSIANKNKCFTKPDVLDGNEVFSTVSRQPEYPGGLQQFYKDVLKNLKHPKERGKLSEKLTFTFIIDKEGHVRNFCFIDPTDGRHDKQIDSLVSNIDKWSPGELYNRKVNTRMLLPMTVEWK